MIILTALGEVISSTFPFFFNAELATGTWGWQGSAGACKYSVSSQNLFYAPDVAMHFTKVGDVAEVGKCIWTNENLVGTCNNASIVVNGGGTINFKGVGCIFDPTISINN